MCKIHMNYTFYSSFQGWEELTSGEDNVGVQVLQFF